MLGLSWDIFEFHTPDCHCKEKSHRKSGKNVDVFIFMLIMVFLQANLGLLSIQWIIWSKPAIWRGTHGSDRHSLWGESNAMCNAFKFPVSVLYQWKTLVSTSQVFGKFGITCLILVQTYKLQSLMYIEHWFSQEQTHSINFVNE